MDLASFFVNQDRIALALERIATVLEDNQAAVNTISVSASGNGGTVTVEDKPKRTRRTKEQIAADEEAARIAAAAQVPPAAPAVQPQEVLQVSGTFQSSPVGQPGPVGSSSVGQPVSIQPPAAIPVAPPVMEAPAPLAQPVAPMPAPVQAPPVMATTPAPMVTTPPVAAPIAVPQQAVGGTAETDFTHLYNTVAPVFSAGREHIVALLGQYGLQMPISHPDDQSAPGAQFCALTPDNRYALLRQAETLAAQLAARAGQI